MNQPTRIGRFYSGLCAGPLLVLMIMALPIFSFRSASARTLNSGRMCACTTKANENIAVPEQLTDSSGPADSPAPMLQYDAQHTGRGKYAGPSVPHLRWSYLTNVGLSSPALGIDGTLYRHDGAIDTNGILQWATGISDHPTTPAIADDGTIYISSSLGTGPDPRDHHLFAFNPDGTLKWDYKTSEEVRTDPPPAPVVGPSGTIYFLTKNKLFASNPDGSLKWSYGRGARSSPALGLDGTVYFNDDHGTLHAVDSTGSLLWTYAIGEDTHGTPSIGTSGTIYLGSWDGSLYAINPDGTLEWSFPTGGPIRKSSPAISSSETIYTGSGDGKLYAINSNGDLEWAFETEGSLTSSSPSLDADGTIYVGSTDDYVYAINPDGTLKWSYQTGDDVYAPPVVGSDGTLYVTSFDRRIYALWEGDDATIDTTTYVDISNTSGLEDGTQAHPFNQIQEGINFAPDGYTVEVAPGTYSEGEITIIDHDIALIGAGATTTTIDGGNEYYTLSIGRGVSDATIVKGFTITNNWGHTACISMSYSASPLISNNILTGCNHYAISMQEYASPRIINNTVVGNSATGIQLAKHSYASVAPVIVKNNIIANNTGYGIQLTSGFGSPQLSYNDIWQNANGDYEGVTRGEGGFSEDPLFINATSDDYHLQDISPAVDAGDPTFDFTGEPLPNGGRVNMGAYGNTEEAARTPITASQSVGAGDPPPVTFGETDVTIDFSNSPGGNVAVTKHTAHYLNPPSTIHFLYKYWDIVTDFSSEFTASLSFTYTDSDLNGASETDIAGAAHWDARNARWEYVAGTVDAGANTATLTDITGFSEWALMASSPPQAVASLSVSKSGNDAELNWNQVTLDIQGNTISSPEYKIYRKANDPYYWPTTGDLVATVSATSYTDVGAIGDPNTNNYYIVTAVDSDGHESAISERWGEFDFALTAGDAGNDRYNVLALPLDVTSELPDAAALAAHIGSSVQQVLQWRSDTQTYATYYPEIGFGTNFALEAGGVYRVKLDDTAPLVVSFLGPVPAQGSVQFSLTGASPDCRRNVLSIPLDRSDITKASELAAAIGGVEQVLRWNAETQTYQTYYPEIGFGTDFSTPVGTSVRVCLQDGAPSAWP